MDSPRTDHICTSNKADTQYFEDIRIHAPIHPPRHENEETNICHMILSKYFYSVYHIYIYTHTLSCSEKPNAQVQVGAWFLAVGFKFSRQTYLQPGNARVTNQSSHEVHMWEGVQRAHNFMWKQDSMPSCFVLFTHGVLVVYWHANP